MSKEEMRKRLKELSFADKIKILERLRDRSVLLSRSGLRVSASEDLPRQTSAEREKE